MIRSTQEWERACRVSQLTAEQRRQEALDARVRRERRHRWYWRIGLVLILTMIVAVTVALAG